MLSKAQGGRSGHASMQTYTVAGPASSASAIDGGASSLIGSANDAASTAAPAWSELKTKAGKERKRLPLACKSCRRKKVRCSGETPSCKHCLRARIPCVYKVTQRKATPRTDYLTMLDKRLKRMEERVIKVIPPSDAGKASAVGRASVRPFNADRNKTQAKKRAAVEAFAPSETDDHEKPSMVSSIKDKSETSSLMEGVEFLPPADIQEHLAETYFDFCYGQPYHLLHKPSFTRRLRAGTIPPVLMLAVCSIAARFSTHSYFDGEPPSLRGDQWANEARRIAARSFGEPNMTVVIVVTLLALYDFGSCQGGRAWMYAGIAMRMSYALQLNQEHGHETAEGPVPSEPHGGKDKGEKHTTSELSFTDQEIRRRTMWACFLMDCFNSSGTKRPSFDHIPNIKIQLPIKEEYFQMEIAGRTEDINGNPGKSKLQDDLVSSNVPRENMDVAAYLVKILELWNCVVQYTNSGRMHEDPRPPWDPQSEFIQLRAKVYTFWKELPAQHRYCADNVRNHDAARTTAQFAFMHIVYQQIILFLHKFTIPAFPDAKLPPQMPDVFRDEARKSAVQAATKISKILEDNREGQLTAPFASYCTFASSTVHIWGVFSGNKQLVDSCKVSLGINMRYLFRMRKYWSMIHYMTESVKEIYKKHADAARPGLISKAGAGDESFFEYGDMQDRKHPPVAVEEEGSKQASSPSSNIRYTQLGARAELQSVGDWFQEKSNSPQLLSVDMPNRPSKRGKSLHAGHASQSYGASTTPPSQAAASPQHAQGGMKLDAKSMSHIPTPPDSTNSGISFGLTSRGLHNTHSPPAFPDPTAGTQFPVSNPYHDLNLAAPFGNAAGSGVNGGNAFFPRLPMQAYDRQLVYGAYAQDPTLTFDSSFDASSAAGVDGHTPGGFGASPGGGLDVSSAGDSAAAAHLGMGAHHGMSGPGHGLGNGDFGDASAAWLTPFHLVPPINLVQPEYADNTGQEGGMGFGMSGDSVGGPMDFWNA